MIEKKITIERYDNEPKTNLNDIDVFSKRAVMVMEMISRWGMVAGEPDGEDSNGRTKLKLLSEKDLVKRAFKISDLMFEELEIRDWMIQSATFEELELAKENILEEIENKEQQEMNH